MPTLWNRTLETVLVALVYVLTARLGQTLAIAPGNVTPVWIPSGLMLTWALIRGSGIWPGVFLGAFLGNAWAYFDPSSLEGIAHTLMSGIPNGIGDSLASVGSACVLHRYFQPFRLFQSVPAVSAFLAIGVVGGAAVSALFGVSGLLLAGLIPGADYSYVFATWVTGDAVGVLVFAPLALAIVRREKFVGGGFPKFEAVANFLLISTVGFIVFWGNVTGLVLSFHQVASAVLLIWAALRLSGLYNSILIFYLAAGITVATALGHGPFSELDVNSALINSQLLIAVVGVLLLMLHANREQVRLHVQSLEQAKKTLNQKVRERTAELEKAKADAERLASTDVLTGAPNRRMFFERGAEEFNRVSRKGDVACLIMFDIDRFKRVNDTYGHQIGDLVLKDLAHITMKHIRNYDMFGRIGGEEFAVILPGARAKEAVEVAEKLRKSFRERRVPDLEIGYTASFGVTDFLDNDKSLSDVIRRADIALYKAKTQGRNQVVVFEEAMDDDSAATICGPKTES